MPVSFELFIGLVLLAYLGTLVLGLSRMGPVAVAWPLCPLAPLLPFLLLSFGDGFRLFALRLLGFVLILGLAMGLGLALWRAMGWEWEPGKPLTP